MTIRAARDPRWAAYHDSKDNIVAVQFRPTRRDLPDEKNYRQMVLVILGCMLFWCAVIWIAAKVF